MSVSEFLIELPNRVHDACKPLFDALPLEVAMPRLSPTSPQPEPILNIVRAITKEDVLKDRYDLQAGLWLYVDDLQSSHRVSQELPTREGAIWHAIMHRREGDFANSKYWWHQAGNHEALKHIPKYDPIRFVEQVAERHPEESLDLVEIQRAEWREVFLYCAKKWTSMGGLR